jgi:hypothetical protein
MPWPTQQILSDCTRGGNRRTVYKPRFVAFWNSTFVSELLLFVGDSEIHIFVNNPLSLQQLETYAGRC